MQKKNIAIMIDKMYGGGAERVAANLSSYLPVEKYNKTVITFDYTNKGYNYYGEIINLKTKPSPNIFVKITNFIKRVFYTNKIKKEKNINVTISLLSGPNLINILTRKNNKVIISVRNFMSASPNSFYDKINKFLIKILYNKADMIIAVSEEIKQDLIDNFNISSKKIQVIYNFYDIGEIERLSREEVIDNAIFNFPTVITSGSLSKQKGQWHLIRAFKKIKKEIPNAKLIILGEGKLKKYLQNLAIELSVGNDIHFLGFKDNPFKYLAKADIFAFPSLYEGFPNALCEAMACGLPVISSDCSSGPKEILRDYNNNYSHKVDDIDYTDYGILTPMCDGKFYQAQDYLTDEEKLLAKSIIKLFENKNKMAYYKRASKIRIKDFEEKLIISQWEQIIDSVFD